MSGEMFNEEKASGRIGFLVIAFVAVMCAVLGVVIGLSMGGGDAGASTPTPSTTVATAAKPEAYQMRCMMTPVGGAS